MKRIAKFRHDKPVKREAWSKGYRVHKNRIINKVTRSIKYPLVVKDEWKKRLIDDAAHDYRWLVGPINYSDWCRDPNQYSILEFWIDFLCVGGVFQSSHSNICRLAIQLSGGSVFEQEWKDLSPFVRANLIQGIKPAEFIGFLTAEFRSSSNPKNFISKFFEGSNEDLESLTNEFASIVDFIKAKDISLLRKSLPSCKKIAPNLWEKAVGSHSTNELLKLLTKYTRVMLVAEPSHSDRVFSQTVLQSNDQDDPELTGPLPSHKVGKASYLFIPEFIREVNLDKISKLDLSAKSKLAVEQVKKLSELTSDFKQIENQSEAYFGLSTSFNELSNFLGILIRTLRNAPEAILKDQIALCAPLDKDILKITLDWLCDRAQALPENPRFETNWAEYRSYLGGKIKSWFSNYENFFEIPQAASSQQNNNREKKLGNRSAIRALNLKKEAFEKARETFKGDKGTLEKIDLAYRLLGSISPEVLQCDEGLKLYQQFNDELLVLNETINQKFQDAKRDIKAKKEKESFEKLQRNLSSPLPRIPEFFGERAKKGYQKARVSPKLARHLLECLNDWLARFAKVEESAFSEKEFQRILDWLRTSDFLPVFIRKSKDPPSWLRYIARVATGKYYFWVSEYSRKRVQIIDKPIAQNPLKELISWFLLNKDAFSRDNELFKGLSSKMVTLARIMAGILRDRGEGLKELQAMTSKLDNIGLLHPSFSVPVTDSLKDAAFYRAFFSELEGLLNIGRSRLIIERITLQSQQSKNKKTRRPLMPEPFINEDKEVFLAFPKFETKNKVKGTRVVYNSPDEVNWLLSPIRSSKGQLSFMFRCLSEDAKIMTTSGGCSYIVEFKKLLEAQEEVLSIHDCDIIPRAFVSIPFTLERESEETKPDWKPNRFMGVDIGEYAVAYCVIEKGTDSIEILDCGIVRNGAHRVLKEKVDRLKRRQRSMTFGAMDTSIAAARESLVGNYRNRLHAIALKHGAKLVYEYEVSAFESGGNRIKKVYETLKKSDCTGETEADKNARKHIWGETNAVGDQIGAGWTSQTCAKCGRSFGADLKAGNFGVAVPVPEKVEDSKGHYAYHEFPFEDGLKVRGFLKPNKIISDQKELAKAVHAYMRPPLVALGKRKLPKNARYRRGNSSLFRCPFSDCGFTADADIQAAYNIAVKQLYKPKKGYPKERKWQDFVILKPKEPSKLFDKQFYRPN